jgi:hypothetical protein
MTRFTHDESPNFRDPEPEATRGGIYVYGLERTINPETDLDGRQLRQGDEPPPESGKLRAYAIGLDIGARHDRTALAVLELRYKGDTPHLFVKYLKRLKLGILFADVATQTRRVVSLLRKEATKNGARCDITLLVDASGVGGGVAEMIVAALPNEDVRSVFITGGQSARLEDGGHVYLSKSLLVSNLVALFESHRIYLSKYSREMDALLDELANFEVKVSEDTGNESYNAKTGKFDDLVTALGLAAWWGERNRPARLF